MTVVDGPDDQSLLEPGKIFIAPFPVLGNPYLGPHILEQNGVSLLHHRLVAFGTDACRT